MQPTTSTTGYPQLSQAPERRLLAETLRRMLSAQVHDLVNATRAALAMQRPADADAVRRMPPLVSFSSPMQEQATVLKRLLFASLYRHSEVERTTSRARDVLRTLFEAYKAAPAELPAEHQAALERHGLRALADYIAGMTDRFAAREYRRLTGAPAFESD
jgi:dGTPase